LVSYEYDGQGRITKERRHAASPVSALWSEHFNTAPKGLSDIPADYMSVANGKLIVATANLPSASWAEVRGQRNYTQAQNVIFSFEVETGAQVTGRYLMAGIDGEWGVPGYRRHGVMFDGDSIFVSYYDNGYKDAWLSVVDNNTVYIVEVATDATGSTLYVYPKGKTRADGVSDRRGYADWNSIQAIVEGMGGPGLPAAKMYVNSITEAIGTGQDLGGVIAIDTDSDPVKEYFYDDSNRLIGVNNINNTFVSYQYDNNGNPITQTIHALPLLPTLWTQDFDRNANGFWDIAPGFMSVNKGRLQVATITRPDWQWPGASGKRNYPQSKGVKFIAGITTGSVTVDRYLVLGLEGDKSSGFLRRHCVYIDGDSVFATYYDNGFQDYWLGLVKPNTKYIVEIDSDINGSTLNFYEESAGKASALVDRRNYNDWGNMQSVIEAYGYPGANGSKTYVNYIAESLYSGDVVGNYIVQNSANDLTVNISQ